MDQPFADLVKAKALSLEGAAYLQRCIEQRANVLITGPSRNGAGALQKGIVALIPPDEKVAIFAHPDVVKSRPGERITSDDVRHLASAVPSAGEVIRLALDLKPSRVVLHEVMTDEVIDFFLAMEAGCAGSVTYVRSGNMDVALTCLKSHLERALARRTDVPSRARDANGLIRRQVQVLVNIEGATKTMRVTRVAEFNAGLFGTSLTDLFVGDELGLTRTRQRSKWVREA